MNIMQNSDKESIKLYWEENPCGADRTNLIDKTDEYYQDIEDKRYNENPEIFSFAQFSRFRGKKVLEVGLGMGTDFIQWIRSGADTYGVDLTEESIENTKRRMNHEGISAHEIKRCDAENLPFEENSFDLVYSWGVIHHSPDTEKALNEIFRVCKKNGICKIMVYNRHSVEALRVWVDFAFKKAVFWRPISWVLANYYESPGTRAYTKSEIIFLLNKLGVTNYKIISPLTQSEQNTLKRKNFPFTTFLLTYIFSFMLGWKEEGFFLMVEFKKP